MRWVGGGGGGSSRKYRIKKGGSHAIYMVYRGGHTEILIFPTYFSPVPWHVSLVFAYSTYRVQGFLTLLLLFYFFLALKSKAKGLLSVQRS